jgi:hypothetical protein
MIDSNFLFVVILQYTSSKILKNLSMFHINNKIESVAELEQNLGLNQKEEDDQEFDF